MPPDTATRSWAVNAIAWMARDPSGQRLATLDGRCLLQVWQPTAAAPALERALDCPHVDHPADLAVTAAWTAAGERLAISTPDQTITIVAVPSGRLVAHPTRSDTITSMGHGVLMGQSWPPARATSSICGDWEASAINARCAIRCAGLPSRLMGRISSRSRATHWIDR